MFGAEERRESSAERAAGENVVVVGDAWFEEDEEEEDVAAAGMDIPTTDDLGRPFATGLSSPLADGRKRDAHDFLGCCGGGGTSGVASLLTAVASTWAVTVATGDLGSAAVVVAGVAVAAVGEEAAGS
jgi:hypothetical protein